MLRSEKEDLYKQSHSLLEERRLARGELLKQKTELETYRNFSNATKEAVCDDKVDVRGERRMMMLQKVSSSSSPSIHKASAHMCAPLVPVPLTTHLTVT